MNLGKLFGKHKVELHKSALTSDVLRDNVISESESDVKRFSDWLSNEPVEPHRELIRDVARAAFSYDEPRLRERDSLLPSHRFNREVLSQVMAQPAFQQSRIHTSGNPIESMFAAMAMSDTISDAYARSGKIDEQEKLNEVEQSLQDAQKELEDWRAQAKQEFKQNGKVSPGTKNAVTDANNHKRVIAEALESLVGNLNPNSDALVAADIAEEAASAANKAAATFGSLPGMGTDSAAQMSPDAQFQLAEQWVRNDQLRQIAEMAGRMKRDMRFKRKARTKHVKVQPVGITTGNDIARMLPREMAMAMLSSTRAPWAKQYAERSLLEYKMGGKEDAGKGPAILLVDKSSSMGGAKMVWAQSLMLSIVSIMNSEKRTAAICYYDSQCSQPYEFDGKKAIDLEQVTRAASTGASGGTDTTAALGLARTILVNAPSFKQADVILLSDGQDRWEAEDAELVKEINALRARIFGVSIMAPNNSYLAHACEWVEDVANLAASNSATDRLAASLA